MLRCSTLASAGKLKQASGAGAARASHARGPAGRGAGDELRRAVAVPAGTCRRCCPIPKRDPDFDEDLRLGFRRETELFFGSILREDRSVLDLLTAKYTFVNERLAKHYGIPHIRGTHFRRVEPPTSGAGGCSARAACWP